LVVPLLLVLAVVLVAALAFNLANLDTGGEAIPQAPVARAPDPASGASLPEPIVTQILAILFGFVFLGGAILILRNRVRGKTPARSFTWWQVLVRALGLALLIAVVVAWPRAVQTARDRIGTQANATANPGTFSTVWPASAGGAIELFLIAGVLVAVASLAILLSWGNRSRTAWDEASLVPEAREAAADAVQTTIQEIEDGGDVRAAILACFQRFCALLGSRGFPEQAALSPRELEGLAVDRLHVSRDASDLITSLFEVARYSEHPLAEADRVRAVDSLGRIRTALEA
jgi:hypothetical protein